MLREHVGFPITLVCGVLELPRSSYYYDPVAKDEDELVKAIKPSYLTSDEVNRLLESVKSNQRDYAIIQLLLHIGIRLTELAWLTLSDLNTSDLIDKAGNKIGFIKIVLELFKFWITAANASKGRLTMSRNLTITSLSTIPHRCDC